MNQLLAVWTGLSITFAQECDDDSEGAKDYPKDEPAAAFTLFGPNHRSDHAAEYPENCKFHEREGLSVKQRQRPEKV